MRIVGTLTGAAVGAALIFAALSGFGGCCGAGAPPTTLGTIARELSAPGFFLACQFNSWGISDMAAMALGGAIPGAVAGLGLAALIRMMVRRRRHAAK
jgi:hypothetical protein